MKPNKKFPKALKVIIGILLVFVVVPFISYIIFSGNIERAGSFVGMFWLFCFFIVIFFVIKKQGEQEK